MFGDAGLCIGIEFILINVAFYPVLLFLAPELLNKTHFD
jgi:hypothetical protein